MESQFMHHCRPVEHIRPGALAQCAPRGSSSSSSSSSKCTPCGSEECGHPIANSIASQQQWR
jgi:hypothetical protein